MTNGQQAGDTLHDNGIGWAIMLAVFAVLIWIFWFFFQTEIREMVRWIRYAEMWAVSWFLPSDYEIVMRGKSAPWWDFYQRVPEFKKSELAYSHLALFSALAMQPLKLFFVGVFSLAGMWCLFKGPRTYYRKRLDLEGLIERQSAVFPGITPFVKFNPATQPPRPPGAPVPAELPLFAEALGPEEWLSYFNVQVPDGNIDRESAAAAFRKQLGKPWRGAKALDPYKQILLATFCLKASRKRVESYDMLSRLSKCWSFKNGLDLSKDKKLISEARKVLRNKKLAGGMMSQVNRHAFETTAMIRALQYAREEGGVLAPAEFVWLRAHDRTLWYPLNNTGRQSFHMEALGAMAHFKAEKMTQRPIPVAKVDSAVDTIEKYMKSSIARPIPQLDYTHSKKRGVKKAV